MVKLAVRVIVDVIMITN